MACVTTGGIKNKVQILDYFSGLDVTVCSLVFSPAVSFPWHEMALSSTLALATHYVC